MEIEEEKRRLLKEKRRESRKRCRERLLSDPVAYEAAKKKRREQWRKRKQNKLQEKICQAIKAEQVAQLDINLLHQTAIEAREEQEREEMICQAIEAELVAHLDINLLHQRAIEAQEEQERELRSKVSRVGVERTVGLGQHGLVPPSPLHIPGTSTFTPTFRAVVPSPAPQQSYYGYKELLGQDQSIPNQIYYNPNCGGKSLDPFGLNQPTETVVDLHSFLTSELAVPSILEATPLPTQVPAPEIKMIDNKRPKREPKVVVPNDEPKYIVTTNSGNPKISRNRKRTTGIGSFSRLPKSKPAPATKHPKSTIYDDLLVDKPPKSPTPMSRYPYTALQERLKLIEPTPTGEDPYQIGEAEMREQSPIPKLMLQKTNHGRMRICTDSASGVTSTITSTTATRRIFDTMSSTTSSSRSKRGKQIADMYSASNMHVQSKKDEAEASEDDQELVDVEKTDTDSETDWRIFTLNKPRETSLCDFSYGETSANLVNMHLDISKMDFPDLFEPGPVNADSSSVVETETAPEDQQATEKNKKRGPRTTSLAGPLDEEISEEPKPAAETKRGRKRAHSTAASAKRGDSTQQKAPAKPRARRAIRAKKTPVPGMMTKKVYHTNMGDPDLSWYYGLDPDIKKEDCDPTECTSSNVEVPRWREKYYSGTSDSEGTENLNDKVFEKRHQKLEAEERRQLRWHMRRVREQRHVERLRQRQRDPWGPNSSQANQRGQHTVWPQPLRDLQFIEITDTIPVLGFGDEVPEIKETMFELPWVRLSKALKRSKRSKTLH